MEASNSSINEVAAPAGLTFKFMWFAIGFWVTLFLIILFGNYEISHFSSLLIGDPTLAGYVGIGTTIAACFSCFYLYHSTRAKNFKGFSRGSGLYIFLGVAGVFLTFEAPVVFVGLNLLILFLGSITGAWLGYKLGQRKKTQKQKS